MVKKGWIGKLMMNSEGKIGKVVSDSNGVFRVLTIEFEDGIKEELWLANQGPNPERSRKWKWLFKYKGKEEWVLWGK